MIPHILLAAGASSTSGAAEDAGQALKETADQAASTASDTLFDLQSWALQTGGKALDFLIKIALAMIVYFIVAKIVKKLCAWLEGRLEKFGIEKSVRRFTVSLIKYGILIFTLISIIVKLDIVEASSIAALIASAGVGISLAMQGTLSNFAGGVLLLLLRPFQVGDYIMVESAHAEGTVQEIEMYYTKIATIDNKHIAIPNSMLTNNAVTNLTAADRRQLEFQVGISYDADIAQAKDILNRLIREDERIPASEARVFVSELADSCVKIAFRAWIPTDQYFNILWDMNENVKYAFDEAGIEIPYNQLEVTLKQQQKGQNDERDSNPSGT